MMQKTFSLAVGGLAIALTGCVGGGGGASGSATGGGVVSETAEVVTLSSNFQSDRLIASVNWSQTGGSALEPDTSTTCEFPNGATAVYCPVAYKLPVGLTSSQTYTFKATAIMSNGDATSKSTSVTVTPNQATPIFASAGANATVNSGQEFTLDGSGSRGGLLTPDGGSTLTYTWTLINGGGASFPANLSGVQAVVSAPQVSQVTQATYQLRVTDRGGYSATSTVTINVLPNNQRLVTSAGNYEDITLINGASYRLNFNGSVSWQGDDGGTIYSRWVQEAGPTVSISNATSPDSAYTTITQAGVYIFTLVSDSKTIPTSVTTSTYPTNQVSSVAIKSELSQGSLIASATYSASEQPNNEVRVSFYGNASWSNSTEVPTVNAVWKLVEAPAGGEGAIIQNRTSLTSAYSYLSVYGRYTFALYVDTNYIDPNASIIELNSLPPTQQIRVSFNFAPPP